MKFRQLAASNIRGNWHQYAAFFLSSVFSVAVFFLFADFIFHPGVESGYIRGGKNVRMGLKACEYIIVIFSFFFILYSNSAFLKSRKKEFGLYALFGMTIPQLRKLVLYENLLISLLSIVTGIGVGALFSKLFFMAMTELLDVENPIPFQLVPEAVGLTALCFLTLFMTITLLSLVRVGRTPIIELLKASRKPKTPPVYSRLLIVLCVLTLGAGYAMAYVMDNRNMIFLILPVLFLTIIGTYFLFTQGSVALLRLIQRTSSVYLKRTNLITVSQLVFRMKDNARLLFSVAILSAVVLTASATLYVAYMDQKQQVMGYMPQTVSMTQQGDEAVIKPERLKNILREDGVEILEEVQVTGVEVPFTVHYDFMDRKDAFLIPEGDFNRAVKQSRRGKEVALEPGHGYYIRAFDNEQVTKKGQAYSTVVGGREFSFIMDGEQQVNVYNTTGPIGALLVLDDADAAELIKAVPPAKIYRYYGYELKDWTQTRATMDKIYAEIPKEEQHQVQNRVTRYWEAQQANALTLFIGMFVSVLFFVAAGSMIYFKLFTELQEDQALYRSLNRVGVSGSELMKISTTQIAAIFFIPVLIGLSHSAFAMKGLVNIIGSSVWGYGATVAGVFLLMQFLYFAITRRAYMRMIQRS